MREILFRGKTVDSGEWCIGFYCQVADESDGGAMVKHVIVVPTFKTQMGFLIYKVDPSTIGQYTGLTDKNGNKIFEGDIVNIPPRMSREKTLGVVEFGDYKTPPYGVDETNRGFYIHWCNSNNEIIKEMLRRDITFWCKYSHVDVEVIGNTHDNPELWEVTE